MRKIILLLIVLIFLTGCSGIYNLINFVLPDDVEFIACIKELDTPEKISNYILENFTYEVHDFYAPDPYILWKTKKGDCNDMSTFGVFVADYHGYETWQIKIFDNSLYKHYVAVYDEDIWLSITDNQYYFFGFDNFEEIVNYVCYIRDRKWTKYIVYDYWNNEVEIGYN